MKNIFLSLSMLFCIYTNAQTFTLKSNDIGGQATNKQVLVVLAVQEEILLQNYHGQTHP